MLLLLLQEQGVLESKHSFLLGVKTKKEYAKNIFLKKQNKRLLALCKREVQLQHIPLHCWKLEVQWARYFPVNLKAKKARLSLLSQLCAKNVTVIKKEKELLGLDLKSLPKDCAKKVKYSLKTISYRKQK